MLRSGQRLFISKTTTQSVSKKKLVFITSPLSLHSRTREQLLKAAGMDQEQEESKSRLASVLLPTAFRLPALLLFGQMHAFPAVIPHHPAQVAGTLPIQLIVLFTACHRLIILKPKHNALLDIR